MPFIDKLFLSEILGKDSHGPYKMLRPTRAFYTVTEKQYYNKRRRLQERMDELGDANIHLCWLLSFLDFKERQHRIRQACEIIGTINITYDRKVPLDIFEMIMETCLKYGTLRDVLKIYRELEQQRSRPNAAIIAILLNAIAHAESPDEPKSPRPKSPRKITNSSQRTGEINIHVGSLQMGQTYHLNVDTPTYRNSSGMPEKEEPSVSTFKKRSDKNLTPSHIFSDRSPNWSKKRVGTYRLRSFLTPTE